MLSFNLSFFAPDVQTQTIDRDTISMQHQWNLSDIFKSDKAWEAAKTDLVSRLNHVLTYKGRLASSALILFECLEEQSVLGLDFSKLYSYASMRSDMDTRVALYQGMKQEMSQIGTDYAAKASFIEPELVAMDIALIEKFISEETRLNVYKHYLFDLQRRKAHMLSEAEERILANAGMVTQGPYNIYSIFSNAELPYPDATLSDGKRVKLDQAGFGRFRAVASREDRKIVFKTFWENMAAFKGTLGVQLDTQIKSDIFYARSRHYGSALESALDANAIPVDVYRALIDGVNENLDSFHRYLHIRKRMLGVDTLHYYDLYAPVVQGVDLEYNIDQAWDMVIECMAPMGKEYMDVLQRSRIERWIDVYPTPGKRSGAYSNDGGYDIHPFMLLNYNGKYNDVSTLAHELGHSMHTYFSNKHQPLPLADYSIFVAEVASTFNEALLTDYMLKKIDDDDVRLSLLMEYLDGIKGTVFRQTQFAEYELAIHESCEKGIPLTGEKLTEIYGGILEKYYGHNEGVCIIDDYVKVEWSYIPHFYYNFYVYQYATSFTASIALADRVLKGSKGAVENMLTFLSAGGSDYPIDVLKAAGVDMTTSGPLNSTIQRMNDVMAEIEKILDKKSR
ncbi:oligoendopeptidase F [bacterium]|nr:oligoendopeptidase F [bacterium]